MKFFKLFAIAALITPGVDASAIEKAIT